MPDCPNDKCWQDKEHIKEKIGLMEKDMVLKSAVRWIVGLIVIIGLTFGGIVWNSAAKAKDERVENAANIKVFNVKQEMILQSAKEIKESQERTRNDLEMYKKEQTLEREKFQEKVVDIMKSIRQEIKDIKP